MSTLEANKIKKGSKTVDTDYVLDGCAKAWANFNGTNTVAIRDSLNCSSLVDNGVGDYSINFTNSMNDANYSFTLSGGNPGTAWVTTSINTSGGNGTESAPTTSACRLNTGYNTGASAVTDTKYVNANIYGDLA